MDQRYFIVKVLVNINAEFNYYCVYAIVADDIVHAIKLGLEKSCYGRYDYDHDVDNCSIEHDGCVCAIDKVTEIDKEIFEIVENLI